VVKNRGLLSTQSGHSKTQEVSKAMNKFRVYSSLMVAVLYLALAGHAAALDFTCMRYDDTSEVTVLRGFLDGRSMLHYVNDKNTICVDLKDKDEFHDLARSIFPPEYFEAKKTLVPDSPSGIPVQSAKIIDHDLHQKLKLALTKNDVWYKVDENDSIWYEITNVEKVNELLSQVFKQKAEE